MLDEVQGAAADDGDAVAFLHAGDRVRGAFQCAECGYGVSLHATLPRCPMCSGTSWEPVLRHVTTAPLQPVFRLRR